MDKLTEQEKQEMREDHIRGDYDPRDNYDALEGEVECPNCGSKDTKMYHESNGPDDYNVWIECMECGFQGGD